MTSLHIFPNPQAIADRREAIAVVMADVEKRQMRLAAWIQNGRIDNEDALRRSARMPGVLGDRWREFIMLPAAEQMQALSGTHFRGSTWQALLQCTPYFEFSDQVKTDPRSPGS
jgi:hypothetical protein